MKITTRTGLWLCVLTVMLSSGVATARTGDVIYVADQDTDGVNELYRVDLKTDAVTKLNGPLVAGGDVERWDVIGK